MRYGQSGNVCGIMLVKVARDNKTVLNTNYVLVEDITENTVPPSSPPPPKKKKACTVIPETERQLLRFSCVK